MPSLGNDLASKRKELSLSVEDVHQSTKIPIAILKSIEDDSIFSTLDENKTYIRSYIRSYAKAVKIGDDQIIRALDQTEKGDYTGLSGQPEDADLADEAKEDTSAAKKANEKREESESPGKVSEKPPSAGEGRQQKQKQKQPVSATPKVSSVDWADLGRKFTPLQSKSRLGIGLILLFLAIAATAFIIFYQAYYINDGAGTEPAQNASAETVDTPYADSLQLNFASPVEDSASQAGVSTTALETLSDTLDIVIYAAHGILEPVRVFTDVMENMNPYWIEHEQAFRFEFVNSMQIRGQYSRMELLFNGHPVKNFRQEFYNPETRMLEIDRSYFESDASWLQPPPDSLDIGVPHPAVIIDRPTFY